MVLSKSISLQVFVTRNKIKLMCDFTKEDLQSLIWLLYWVMSFFSVVYMSTAFPHCQSQYSCS